jgi:hypothetical protein
LRVSQQDTTLLKRLEEIRKFASKL